MAPRSEDGDFNSISRKSPKFGDNDEFSFQAKKWELISRSDDYRDPEAWKDGGFPLND